MDSTRRFKIVNLSTRLTIAPIISGIVMTTIRTTLQYGSSGKRVYVLLKHCKKFSVEILSKSHFMCEFQLFFAQYHKNFI